MPEETPTPSRCREWVRTGQRVQARTVGGFVQAVGTAISYTERPTVGIRMDDGNIIDWLAELCVPAAEGREFPVDGPEPPADVRWLEWTHPGQVVPRFVGRHDDGGWAWAVNAGDPVSLVSTPVPWPPARHFSFREVPAGEVPQ